LAQNVSSRRPADRARNRLKGRRGRPHPSAVR
jgi:hypothetical protein